MKNIFSYPLLVVIALSLYGLTACKNSSNPNNTEDQAISVDNRPNSPIANNDTIIYDNSSFPTDSAFSAKVLTVGTFHGDEVWSDVDKHKWLGLFQNQSGFYIAETKLKTKRVNDVVLDVDKNDKTGWNIQTVNKDSSLILITGLNFLTPHNVQQAVLSKEQIYPGDTMQIQYLDIDYKIYARGVKKKMQNDLESFDVLNYKLYLTATIKGKQHTSLLVAQPNFEEQMISILFAGDIDGDEILDLIIDTSRHYNVTSPTIYLSRPADKGEVVKPVGGHTSIGC